MNNQAYMLVGAEVNDCILPSFPDANNNECLYDWAVKHGMRLASPWYDADEDQCFIGYEVKKTDPLYLSNTFIDNITQLAHNFKEVCGTDAIFKAVPHID